MSYLQLFTNSKIISIRYSYFKYINYSITYIHFKYLPIYKSSILII
ncbi:hypothetical protein F383_00656 [Gossypium arboreum]|uniref:Uncharacterized protein n=1 Tax=Gossypium arboreum TaxID=29729 RepID=A0A0B0NY33_GOSAR|nr:hypothetical protein F383_00656 [Gossypium arboreum]